MIKLTKPKDSKSLARMISMLADEKLAQDIIVMDLTKIDMAPSDFFVLCTCGSEPQMKAVVDIVERFCVDVGIKRPKVEGYGKSHWVLLDFFDVVMHIMMRDARDFYRIEKLWNDAVFMQLSENNRLVKLSKE